MEYLMEFTKYSTESENQNGWGHTILRVFLLFTLMIAWADWKSCGSLH